ncbi:hypothetical protein KOR34_34220 [Posidoniimonas corsicana]|uniref:Uncharacterized protein n=2 Tax=Posidoniimonas corsicana TaxID=1938618 RepID=A0A5C5V686_9BACT|nr:hypothetical protein KOR34_34220 [Posidoniimonas corsicana]
MPWFGRIRFSTRTLLLLTPAVALAVALAVVLVQAWPSHGEWLGPAVLAGSFLLTTALGAAVWIAPRRQRWARRALIGALAVLLSIGLLYLSFGPACWAMAFYHPPPPAAARLFHHVYGPIATNVVFAPPRLREACVAYLGWWMPAGADFWEVDRGIGFNVPGWSYTIISY